jgi:hypothetical protein
MPMPEVIQIDAAVVSPRTDSPSFMITPAPRKPMPVMMPWAMRVGSSATRVEPYSALNHSDSNTGTSISAVDARQTRAWVRKPAGRPW